MRWRTIPGFSKYESSTDGNIRNAKTGRLRRPSKIKSAYSSLSVIDDHHKTRTRYVHRLVAQSFIPNPEGLQTVNHKDHDPTNNHVDNLEWASTTEQNRHKRKCQDLSLVSSRAVQQILPYTTIVVAIFPSIAQAADAVGAGHKGRTKICAVARGVKHKVTAYGYTWKYVDKEGSVDEEWRSIDPVLVHGVTGYEVSSKGRLKNHKGRITMGHKHHSGYTWASIYPKQYMMHILVAKTFLCPPTSAHIVNHIDGDTENAHLCKMEYLTLSENVLHGRRLKRQRM